MVKDNPILNSFFCLRQIGSLPSLFVANFFVCRKLFGREITKKYNRLLSCCNFVPYNTLTGLTTTKK